MNYEIVESHQVFQEGKLQLVAVLWKSNPDGSVRATFFDRKKTFGHSNLENETLNEALLQRIAAQGSYLPDNLKKKFFSGKRKWER